VETLAAALASCGSLLVLDTAGQPVHAGLLRQGSAPVWCRAAHEAGVGLFAALESIVAQTGVNPSEAGGFVFDEGPGSQLGLRTAAMAIRTWQVLTPHPRPVFSYRSLSLAAAALPPEFPRPLTLALDARRDAWHVVRVGAHPAHSPVARVPTAELARSPEPLATLAGFRAWSPPPRPWSEIPFDPAAAFTTAFETPLLLRVERPEPWHSLPPEYRRWSGERHRAPSPAPTRGHNRANPAPS
jgi:tRNA threonylcarbamoyladenosine biosynthesis protein TsaB